MIVIVLSVLMQTVTAKPIILSVGIKPIMSSVIVLGFMMQTASISTLQ